MDIFDCWIYIMKNMNMFEQMPFSEKYPVFRKLAEIGELRKLSREELELYDEDIKDMRDISGTRKCDEKKTNAQTQQLAKLNRELDSVRDELLEFKSKQAASLAAFRNKQTARRTEINEQIFALRYQIKHNRVLINEEHQNKLGLAFAEYNRERREAGLLPIGFDMQPKRHPEDPNSVSAKIIENETETDTPQH